MSILVSSRRSPKAGRFGEAPKSFSFNSASQLTNAGYVYDGLGRNTSIPAADSPNSVGVISLSYRVNDQVSSITQNGVATAYSFDGLGRRVSETTGSSVLTKHYTGTSDNPAWSSNNAGVTDIYTSSLGTGLNSTVTLDNGVKTLSLDVNDLRGNTVTRINVDAATTDSWVSFDEYGNREGASTGKLVTYDAYGQYERATTSQGLILMGARVYNPVTNQFTSPDPVTGGNETSYTYPNDPASYQDLDGLCQYPSSSKTPFCAPPGTQNTNFLIRAWAGFGFRKVPDKPIVLGQWAGNFQAYLKNVNFTTYSVRFSNWNRNKAFIDVAIKSGLRIYLSDNPFAKWPDKSGRGKTYGKELRYLKELGFKFYKSKNNLWEARRE